MSITYIAIFLIILIILLEILAIYEVYRSTKNDIYQILNIVLNDSLNKELRESISTIDENSAMSLFNEKVNILSSKKTYKDKVNIFFTQREISSNPAYFSCQGYIQIAPTFSERLGVDDLAVKLPFRMSAFIQIK